MDFLSAEWPAGGTDELGLIVAYDLDHHESVDVLKELRRHRPGQILWAHASCWTQPFPYAPDLNTFLYEALSVPWLGRRHLAPDREGAGPFAAGGDPGEEELAARIVAAELPAERQDGDEELAALLGAIRAVPPPHTAGPFLDEGPRALQRIGGPVKSNDFG